MRSLFLIACLPFATSQSPPPPFPPRFVYPHTCSSGVLPTLGWSTTNVASNLPCRGKAARLPNASHKTTGGGGRQIRCGCGVVSAEAVRPHGRRGTWHSFSACTSAVRVRLVDVADEIRNQPAGLQNLLVNPALVDWLGPHLCCRLPQEEEALRYCHCLEQHLTASNTINFAFEHAKKIVNISATKHVRLLQNGVVTDAVAQLLSALNTTRTVDFWNAKILFFLALKSVFSSAAEAWLYLAG